VQVYDSLGVGHTLNLVYTKTADLTYTVKATLDGTDAPLTPTDLTFDSDGQLTTPASPAQLVVSPDQTTLNGATLPTININLYQPDGTSNLTNLAAASGVSSTRQDGFAAGTVTGLLTDKAGVMTAVFSNGQTRPLGQLALATFNSNDGLKALGGNLFGEWIGSGPPSIGRPAAAGRGEISGQALEQSNVDIAKEFTNLIVAQRSYQANSRVITTFNQALQDLLQII
jgi:flagellar hook protein FlgE